MSSQSLVDIPNRRILDKHFVAQIIGEPVKEYAISPGAKPGDNIMGTLLCLDVKTVSNEIHHLVIKSVIAMTGIIDRNTLSVSKLMAALKTFPREILYYKQIRPIFQNVHKGNQEYLSFFTSPKHYFCLQDEEKEGLQDCLVLEDLRPKGYKMVDKFKGLNYEETVAALKQLALLHATSYALLNGQSSCSSELQAIQQDATSLVNIHKWTKDLINGWDREKYFNGVVSKMIQLVQESGQVEMAEKIYAISKDGHKILMDLWKRTTENGQYFRVLHHGDLWTNNILFKYSPDGTHVQDVKFIDFQMIRFGNIYEDLQYFIFTSTTTELRNLHLKSCLQSYYQEFERVLQELKCLLPTGFTEEQVVSTFHQTLDYGFVYNLLAIPFQLGLTPPPPSPMTPIEIDFKSASDNQSFSSIAKDSSEAASANTNAYDFKPDFQKMTDSVVVGLQNSTRNSPIALKRLNEMIEEMVELGLIN